MCSTSGDWAAVIDRLVILRNDAELRPAERAFVAHRQMQNQLFRAHQRVTELRDENSRLIERNRGLVQRVRTLETTSAGVVNRTNRENELEAKLADVQRQLQETTVKEKDYYKAQYDVRKHAEENEKLRGDVAQLTETATQREGVLRMMRNEYVALKQEIDIVRPKLNALVVERDRCLRDLLSTKEKMAKMQNRILEYEDELNTIRRLQRTSHVDPNAAAPQSQSQSQIQTQSPSQSPSQPPSISQSHRRTAPVPHAVPSAHGDRPLYAICATDDGQRLFTGGGDRCVRHWDAAECTPLRSHTSADVPLCLDSASHYLLAGCADGVARFWDTRSLRPVELTGHSEKIVAAYLLQSAQAACTASSDRTIKLWDVRQSALTRTMMCQSSCNDLCVADTFIISAHYNGSLWVWDRRTAGNGTEVRRAHQQSATCVRLTPCGLRCVSLGRDGVVSVRDARVMDKELLRIEHADLRVSTNLARLALSPDGTRCAVGNASGDILLLGLSEGSGNGNSNSNGNGNGDAVEERLSGGHQGAAHSVVWAHGEPTQVIASIGEDKRIVVWK